MSNNELRLTKHESNPMNQNSLLLIPAFFCLIACSETTKPTIEPTIEPTTEPTTEAAAEAAPLWDGTYLGNQSSYFLTNASGEPMVIGGQKIPVPGSTYTIVLQGLEIEVNQIADDSSMEPVFYVGSCVVNTQSDSSAQLSCVCKEQSSSTYPAEPNCALAINLADGSMVVSGNFGPDFESFLPATSSNDHE